MTRLEFLNETVNHYNSLNRCVSPIGECKYNPKTIGLEGVSEGCAIGRKLSPELSMSFDEIKGTALSVVSEKVFPKLPIWMQELGEEFLKEVQMLHDGDNFWCIGGLSESGAEQYSRIVKKFCLPSPSPTAP